MKKQIILANETKTKLSNLYKSTIFKLYQQTYLDPKLLPFTRDFSASEMEKWTKQDKI